MVSYDNISLFHFIFYLHFITKFKQNSVITSFDELKYFTNNLVAPTNPDVGLSYGAFLGCVNLESVTLMPNIKRLDNNIFNGCTSLKHIDIPNTIQYIGSDIFMGCTSLMTVNLPLEYMPTEFPSAIFRNCSSLTSLIEIPDTVTSIGMAAFMGCSSLEGVKMKGTTPPTLGYGVFNDTTFPIYVPKGAASAYKSASGWTSLASRIIEY
ncbi:leucine-rich repeat domain-containing protein [Bacteroides ovatus]|nr:leucine-rich repeat domain-containing protein [Bacteroides ovatus]KAA4002822.1 leucine-rich repeat domain-containing protein [Bacteroides ovatus]KAA4016496.1 leucine-rich repeat domain-containing protein [Bacteroides ovatus]KAA4024313.1 leucine-rich repeat domain-containing protein [Bacteroides ovatus]KAA4037459.1 leucine-rich repeat domain-containing protein [Bacteroides ovatus]